ncbi:MAG: hypothetical protein RDV48_14990 [Candidatus Eremiobacteraeota bacterium]|nr:hypothetical protein [Candidatus Eremiobacteraeota bacterium]
MKRSLIPVLILALLAAFRTAAFPQEPQPGAGFSGKYNVFTDGYNGYSLKIPAEFTLDRKGAGTSWIGPSVGGGITGIYVNVTEMKGISSQAIYDGNIRSMKEKSDFTNVFAVKMKPVSKKVYAFRCREAIRKPGSPDEKPLDESHSWFLYAFGNERSYQLTVSGRYGAFKENKVQSLYEEVINSFELIPVKR